MIFNQSIQLFYCSLVLTILRHSNNIIILLRDESYKTRIAQSHNKIQRLLIWFVTDYITSSSTFLFTQSDASKKFLYLEFILFLIKKNISISISSRFDYYSIKSKSYIYQDRALEFAEPWFYSLAHLSNWWRVSWQITCYQIEERESFSQIKTYQALIIF